MAEFITEIPELREYVSPLSVDDIGELTMRLRDHSAELRGKISGIDAARVFVAHAWLMSKLKDQDNELSGIVTEVPRRFSYVQPVSSVASSLMGSAHMRRVHSTLLRLAGGETAVKPSADEPTTPPSPRALKWSGQASRLVDYMHAQAGLRTEPRLRMIELQPMLKVWCNTLPAAQRDEWLSRSIILQGERYLPLMDKEGKIIWRFWGGYLLSFGQDLRHFDLKPQWRLPLYTPFNAPTPMDAGVPTHRPHGPNVLPAFPRL